VITSPVAWQTVPINPTVTGTGGIPGIPVSIRVGGSVVATGTPASGLGTWSVPATFNPGVVTITAEPDGMPWRASAPVTFTADPTKIATSVQGASLVNVLALSKQKGSLTNDGTHAWTWQVANFGVPGIWAPAPQNATEWAAWWTAFKAFRGQSPDAAAAPWFPYLIPWAWNRSGTGSEPFDAAHMIWGTGTAHGNTEAVANVYAGWAADMVRYHPEIWNSDVHYFEDWANAYPIDAASGAVAIPTSISAVVGTSIMTGGEYNDTGALDEWDMMNGATTPIRSFPATVALARFWQGMRVAALALPTPDTARAATYQAKLDGLTAAIATFKQKTGATWDTGTFAATGGQWVGGAWNGLYYLSSNSHEPLASGASSGNALPDYCSTFTVGAYRLASSADLDTVSDTLATHYQNASTSHQFYRGWIRGFIAYPSWHTVYRDTTYTRRYHTNGSYWPNIGLPAVALNRKHPDLIPLLVQDNFDENLRQKRIGGEFWESLDDPTINDPRGYPWSAAGTTYNPRKYHGYENIALSIPVTASEAFPNYVDVAHPGDGSTVYQAFPHGHRVTRIEVLQAVTGSVTVSSQPLVNADGEAYPSPTTYGSESAVALLTLAGLANTSTQPGDVQPGAVWGGRLKFVATGGPMTIRLHQEPPTITMAGLVDPAISITDDFTANTIANYTSVLGSTGSFSIGGGVATNTTNNAYYVRNTADFANGSVQADIKTQAVANRIGGLLFRQSGNARLQININASTSTLYEVNAAGAITNQWTWNVTHTDGVFYTWKLQARGPLVEVYRNGTLLGVVTTTLTSAGKAGFLGNNVSGTYAVNVDNLVIASTASQPIPPGYMLAGWNGTGTQPTPLLTGDTSTSALTGTTWSILDSTGATVVSGASGNWPKY
jgi:hypothetical protein